LSDSQVRLLDHAADIFESQSPGGLDRATIDLAERGSHSPIRRMDCEEELSDTYRLSEAETDDLFTQSEQIGFVDYESAGADRLYFNGSLFKRDQAAKAKRVLESLSSTEQQRMFQADALLNNAGCVQASELPVETIDDKVMREFPSSNASAYIATRGTSCGACSFKTSEVKVTKTFVEIIAKPQVDVQLKLI
jgi:hypothetical protein